MTFRRGIIITERKAARLYNMLIHAIPQMLENKPKRDLIKFKEELAISLFIKQ